MAKRREIPKDHKGWVAIPTIFRDKQTQISDEEGERLEAKNKRQKKFVPPPTPEEFKSFSHIPLKNIEGT